MDLDYIIKLCQNNDEKARDKLFKKYAGLLMSIVRRYISKQDEAEDVLMISFQKIFFTIDRFKFEGSFEGWIKKITVNEALMFIRSNKSLKKTDDLGSINIEVVDTSWSVDAKLDYEMLLDVLEELPLGFRTVFNLYAIEGFKHHEIAEKLNISQSTSKTQYMYAKQRLKLLLKEKYDIDEK